jgi:hypothetical protein
LSKQWCIPPKANAEFVWKMEDVLEVYKRPYDPKRPVVCLDETSKQLIGEVAVPAPPAPGQVAHYDYEYVRNGVANLFMIFEPLAGQRDVEVTERRTKKEYAECLRKIADEMYPDAEVVVVVQDNLNTHSPASLYEAFEPAEAQRLAGRFEFHVYAEARQLAGHGRDRVGDFGSAVPIAADRGRGAVAPGSAGMGTRPRCGGNEGGLAVHDSRCPHQIEETLSIT